MLRSPESEFLRLTFLQEGILSIVNSESIRMQSQRVRALENAKSIFANWFCIALRSGKQLQGVHGSYAILNSSEGEYVYFFLDI